MLPLAEIAAELQQGLDFLEIEMQDIPERHRSIRAAIDYSWQKLDENGRDIFANLYTGSGAGCSRRQSATAGAIGE
jgi:hypothetical protein